MRALPSFPLFPPSTPLPLPSQNYLIGLRGILAIETFLFVFFQTFLPAATVDSRNATGPLYQVALRKSLSVLLWNDAFIYSFVVLLSARTICLPFLLNSTRTVCSSSIFRRGIQLWIPVTVAFSFSAIAFSYPDTSYIIEFIRITGNTSISAPKALPDFLNYFNSLFDIFWVTRSYASQSANQAFPSGTLWIVSLLFQQSYTIYMAMVAIPYTLPAWRVKAFALFILSAWWVQSWAWYSISGLLLADAAINLKFRLKSRLGIQVGRKTLPVWPFYALLLCTGALLQFLFVSWRPQYRNQELRGHTGLYNSASLNEGDDLNEPQARDDCYFMIMGIMLFVETFTILQRALGCGVLVSLGRRSYCMSLPPPFPSRGGSPCSRPAG